MGQLQEFKNELMGRLSKLMKFEPTDGLTKLVKNEIMGGPAITWSNKVHVDGDGSECGGCNVAQVTPYIEI